MAACKTWPGESDPELPEARPGCVWKELNCVTPCIKNKNKSVKGLKKNKRVNYLSFVFKSRTDIHTDISSLPIHFTVLKLMTVSESISNLYWWKSVLQSRSVIKLFNFLECFLNFWRHAELGNLMHFWLKFSNRDFYLIRFKTIFFFTFSCHFPSCYKCTSWSTINRIGIGLGEKNPKKTSWPIFPLCQVSGVCNKTPACTQTPAQTFSPAGRLAETGDTRQPWSRRCVIMTIGQKLHLRERKAGPA